MELGELRHMSIMWRGGYRFAICDYCHKNRGSDLHHIINKGRTHNPKARDASQVLPLMSWLCQNCHIGTFNVHNPEATQELLWYNVHLFGQEAVELALAEVNQYLTIPIILKERSDATEDSDAEEQDDSEQGGECQQE